MAKRGEWLSWNTHLCWTVLDDVIFWIDIQVCDGNARAIVRASNSVVPLSVHYFHPSWIAGRGSGDVENQLMSFLKRKAEMAAGKTAEATIQAKNWAKAHPALNEYLTATEYPDKGKRQTSTLLIFVDGVEWKACLRDRDTDHSLWVTAGSIGEAVEDLEVVLASGEAQWRKSGPGGGGGKSRK